MGTDPPPSVEWPAPNTGNPETRGHGLLIMELVMVSVVMIAVSLRIYTRMFLNRKFWTEDWLIIPATKIYIGLTATVALGVERYGWGKHAWDVPIPARETALLVSFFSELLFTWSLTLTKLSLCYFYLRLRGNASRTPQRWMVYTLIMAIIAWCLQSTFSIIFQCQPVRGMWKINLSGEDCHQQRGGLIAHVVVDIITVVAIYVFPIKCMWEMDLPRRQKAVVVGLFTIGAFVCAASILRLPATIHSTNTYDVTWAMYDTYRWSILECSLAILCATIPSLTPLFCPICTGKSEVNLSSTGLSQNKPFPSHGAHSYPLAHISTTATTTLANNGGWWGTAKTLPGERNESEENIISKEERDVVAGGSDGITKTTVIEQRFEADLEKGVQKGTQRNC